MLDAWGRSNQFSDMAGVGREHEKTVPGRKRRRRFRGTARRWFATQPESTDEYPGFFVLPRATPDSRPQLRRSRLKSWWRALKITGVVFAVFAGFVGALVYIFVSVSNEYTPDHHPGSELGAPLGLRTNQQFETKER